VEPINPWEDVRLTFVERIWRTVYGATIDPIAAFGHMSAYAGERDLSAAVRFALIVSTFGYAPVLLVVPCLALIPLAFVEWIPHELRAWGAGAFCAAIGAIPFALVLGSLLIDVVQGLVFHGLARLLGGRGALRASMHTMLYTSACRFWLCPGVFLGMLPYLHVLSIVLRVAMVIWTGVASYAAARRLHGLGDTASIVVGIFTPLLVLAIVTTALALVVVAIAAATIGTAELVDLARSY
jgi:hypothetical protein